MLSIKYKLISVTVLLAVAGMLVGYVMSLRADVKLEQYNNHTLRSSIVQQQHAIERMQTDFEQIRKINRDLNKLNLQHQNEIADLQNRFNVNATGQSRDFGALAASRPQSIERLVNRGTRNAMRCLELASGAPHTAQELGATTSSQINPECPAIANPNFKSPVP
jgi:TolA-binding protein